MKEVTPGFFVESSYPPYNLVLIITDRGGIVVDLPPSPMHAMNWLEQARGVAGTLRYVILTDGTRDRQMGTAVCDVPIVATETTLQLMKAYDEDRPRRDFMDDLVAAYPDEVGAFDNLEPRKPMLAFTEAITLFSGNHDFQIETVAGAAPGSLWIWAADEELLIAGDTVVSDVVPPMVDVPDSKAWLNTMTALAHHAHVKTIIPGRGAFAISKAEIESQREFMRVMRRAARTIAHNGSDNLGFKRTAQELGQTFFNRQGQQAVKQIKAGLEHLVVEIEALEMAKDEGM
jgi:glyoxylase-like metal-dependent hydrolase (beta-lactamase superfamily II)